MTAREFNLQAEVEKANRDYFEIPSFLRAGSKSSDVPFLCHMRVSFFATAQDIASEIITNADDPQTVKRLANQLYEEAGRYV